MFSLSHHRLTALCSTAFLLGTITLTAPDPVSTGSLSGPVCEAAAPAVKSWDFQKDAQNWAFIGGWSYSGDASAAWDAANGGCLKVNVDFSDDKDQSWSEIKLSDGSVTKASPIRVGAGISQASFDLYYDASQLKGDAALKAKLYASSVKDNVVIDQPIDDMGTAKAKDIPGTTWKKTHVRVIFEDKVTEDIAHLELSIVGYLTSYKGAICIDNIELK